MQQGYNFSSTLLQTLSLATEKDLIRDRLANVACLDSRQGN